jgi:hypothetical protein
MTTCDHSFHAGRCTRCGHAVSTAPLATCDECGGIGMHFTFCRVPARMAKGLRSWSVVDDGERPLTVNAVAKMHRQAWAKHTKLTRERWGWLATHYGIGQCSAVELVVTPLHANRRSPQDVAACAPEAKAAIDGLVDAGLIPDDSPEHLLSVTFLPPLVGGVDGMAIDIREVA